MGLHRLCAGCVDDRAICLVGVAAFVLVALLLTPAFPYEGMTYLAPAWATAAFELIKPTMDHGVRHVLIPISFSFAVLYALNLCIWQLFKTRAEKRDTDLAMGTEDEGQKAGVGS